MGEEAGRRPAQAHQVVAAVAIGAEHEVASLERGERGGERREPERRAVAPAQQHRSAAGRELARERVLHARAEIRAALRARGAGRPARGSVAAASGGASASTGSRPSARARGRASPRARPRACRRRGAAACSGVKGGQSRVFTWPGRGCLAKTTSAPLTPRTAAGTPRAARRVPATRTLRARLGALRAHEAEPERTLARARARCSSPARCGRPAPWISAPCSGSVSPSKRSPTSRWRRGRGCACASPLPGPCSSPSWSRSRRSRRASAGSTLSSSSRPSHGTPASMRRHSSVSLEAGASAAREQGAGDRFGRARPGRRAGSRGVR